MKKIIKNFLEKSGYEIARKNRPPQLSFNKILSILNPRNLFFLEIGANDGKRKDPLYEFVIKNKIGGIAVEPQKDMFEALKDNYRGHPQVLAVNKAIGENNGVIKMYRVDEQTTLTSFNREYLKNQLKKAGTNWKIKEIEVETITLNKLLEGIDKIDILQTDTEGYDYEILKMFNFNKYHPKIIHYESKHLDRSDAIECENYLRKLNYTLFLNGSNTFAI